MTDNLQLYKTMLLIRRFEERALAEFSTGKLFGTTHAYIGQEANAAAIFSVTQPEDIVWSNHRCHGHFLAYGGDPYRLAAELMGKSTGLVGGRGGSQHIQWRNFYSNGIQGGFAPIAAGMALAEKAQKTGRITLAFLGDGTLGEGALYEGLNLAALWQLPVLYVLENNGIAQTTPVEQAVAGSISARFKAFGIETWEAASSDVLTLQPVAREALAHTRSGLPAALILHTNRFSAHSKGDDTRPRELVAKLRAECDPLTIHAPRLSAVELAQAESEISALVDDAFTRAEGDGFPGLQFSGSPVSPLSSVSVSPAQPNTRTTVLESINTALRTALQTDPRVYVLGEDILDPYGGAFKVTRGLSTQHPDRVLTTPISEAAIVGISSGLALRGMRPVAEVMFGDFVTLTADQLINHAAKFRWMYNDKVRVPLVLRAPMGGRRGYGPTHSQSLEKLFLGIPGLKVVAPNTLGHPGELLLAAIADDDPVLFIEHKILYARSLLQPGTGELVDWEISRWGDSYPVFTLRIPNIESANLTIATYGYNFDLALAAAHDLMYEHEIFPEIVLFSQLSPFPLVSSASPLHPLFDSVSRTRRLLTVEEGTLTLGWGAEIAARSSEQVCARRGIRDVEIRRVAALDLPIANSKALEDAILPSHQSILQAALELTMR
jgi:2-oxoisovalerate dehydrogenase E1 component